jgi:hypothetical protein
MQGNDKRIRQKTIFCSEERWGFRGDAFLCAGRVHILAVAHAASSVGMASMSELCDD